MRAYPARLIIRETGMALAVLALWMLSLLVPLHQTSGLLRDLERAGHDISGAWSICVTLAQDDAAGDQKVPVCPAQAIGKTGLAMAPAPLALGQFAPMARDVQLVTSVSVLVPARLWRPDQARAPPLRS
ncbi:hypothetical protein [Gemmobacter serpentinus]|uniref:hypothetical protein n=1 Tax=Gemmobacter serpentinus TaxID=2652247 RepID=UPI00124DBA6D|nr:hypothetical protein [Gemmobacter serpentinus]